LPRRLKREIVDHEIVMVPEMRWAGIKNGDLLRRAEREFDVFVTADQNLSYQQPIAMIGHGLHLGVVVLVARSNRLDSLLPLVRELHEALKALRPGDVIRVGTLADGY